MPQNPLFAPFSLGKFPLKNRIVMAPLTRSRSNDAGVPPSFAAEYYAQRASCGLIIAEATNISPQAVGYALTPGIWSQEQVAAWQTVTEAVHAAGGLIFLQLWHTGRISHPDLQPGGGLPVAPSAVKPTGKAFTRTGLQDHVTPRALQTSEIAGIVRDYRRAAENAKLAGFDGVEVHSANNYLLEQFVRDSTNHRTDQYGGSIENRLRFPLAAIEAAVDVWGADRVGVRISPGATNPGETPLDSDVMATYGAYIDGMRKLGVLYLHVVEGTAYSTREVPPELDFVALRRRFGGVYIANNEYSLELVDGALKENKADLFSFGRAFLANPDLVERLETGAPLADAPKAYWYGGGEVGYSDWPTMRGSARGKSVQAQEPAAMVG